MNIGLDYDDCFTRDPGAWTLFVDLMVERGHKVYIVTWRSKDELNAVMTDMQYWRMDIEGVYATDRKAKEKFMYEQGIRIDVMIDDNPRAWVVDMEKL